MAQREIAVPENDLSGNIASHHKEYDDAVGKMSPSRRRGTEFSSTSFRRLVTGVDPHHDNGWAFEGVELQAGKAATVPVGEIILVMDRPFAKGSVVYKKDRKLRRHGFCLAAGRRDHGPAALFEA